MPYPRTPPPPQGRGRHSNVVKPQSVASESSRSSSVPLCLPGNIGQPSYGPLHILAQLPPDIRPRLIVVAVAPAEYLRYHAAFRIALLPVDAHVHQLFFVSGSGCRLLPRVLTADLLQSAEDGIGHLARSGRAIQIWGPDL